MVHVMVARLSPSSSLVWYHWKLRRELKELKYNETVAKELTSKLQREPLPDRVSQQASVQTTLHVPEALFFSTDRNVFSV